MAKVKGSILIDFVKTIKADKTGACQKYLTDDDRAVIDQRILPSSWYPIETYRNCFAAVVKELARGDMDMVRQWGKLFGETIITSMYKGMVKDGAPMVCLEKYDAYIKSFFDFGEIIVKPVSEFEAEVTFKDLYCAFEPQFHIMRGWIERSLELCGAREIQTQAVSAEWRGDPETRMRVTWKL